MTEIYLLEHLDALARNGTLRSAAEELHISEPALSRSMKKLERDLGVALFIRENSKISLNDTGKFAAECARKALEANREVEERTRAFDRGRHTLTVGTCSTFPMQELLPLLQEKFMGMTIATELAVEEQLILGVQSGKYQIAIVPDLSQAEGLCCRYFLDEHLLVTVPVDHPLTYRKTVSFRDLDGKSILTSGTAGFWLERCRRNMPDATLLIQKDADAMTELADASTLPAFSSDRMQKPSHDSGGRVAIPISDDEASVSYYLVCLESEAKRFSVESR